MLSYINIILIIINLKTEDSYSQYLGYFVLLSISCTLFFVFTVGMFLSFTTVTIRIIEDTSICIGVGDAVAGVVRVQGSPVFVQIQVKLTDLDQLGLRKYCSIVMCSFIQF
jgi:hypothetical protein